MNIADLMIERAKLYKRVFSLKIALILAVTSIILIIYKMGTNSETTKINNDYIGLIKIDFEIFDDHKFDKILESAEKDSAMKALVLDINSPGGSSGASEKMHHKINKIRSKVPVVASIGSIGTSGAYMIALASDRIYALNTSITGSIGVIVQMTEIVEMANKLGVRFKNYKSSPLKATPNPMEITTPESEAAIMSLIKDSHEYFIELVIKGRKLPATEARELSDGRIFTGRQAFNNKLIDEIGTIEHAVSWLKTEKKIAKDLEVIELKPKKHSEFYEMLIDRLEEGSQSLISSFSKKLMLM